MKKRASRAKMVEVDLRPPTKTLEILDALAKQGLLGDTRDDVILHVLRQHLFEKIMLRPVAEP